MRDPVTEGRYLQQHYARAVCGAPSAAAMQAQQPHVGLGIPVLRYRLGAVVVGLGRLLQGEGAYPSEQHSQGGLVPVRWSQPQASVAFAPAGVLAWQQTPVSLPASPAHSFPQRDGWYMAVVFHCEPR